MLGIRFSVFSACVGITLLGWSIDAARAQDAPATVDELQSQLDSQLQGLEQASVTSECAKAVLIALRNHEVRELFLAKMQNRCYTLKEICCLQLPRIREQELVLFNFDCKPDCFCIVDPQFVVIVDRVNGRVEEIINPYVGPTTPCSPILSADHVHTITKASYPQCITHYGFVRADGSVRPDSSGNFTVRRRSTGFYDIDFGRDPRQAIITVTAASNFDPAVVAFAREFGSPGGPTTASVSTQQVPGVTPRDCDFWFMAFFPSDADSPMRCKSSSEHHAPLDK